MTSQASFIGSRLSPYSSSCASMGPSQAAQRAAASAPPVAVRLHELIQEIGLVLAALGENSDKPVDHLYRHFNSSLRAALKATQIFLSHEATVATAVPNFDIPLTQYSIEQLSQRGGTHKLFLEAITGLNQEMSDIKHALLRDRQTEWCKSLCNCLEAAQLSIYMFLSSAYAYGQGDMPGLAALKEEALIVKDYCYSASQRSALLIQFAQLHQDVTKLFDEPQKGEFKIEANEQAVALLRGRFNVFQAQQQELVQKLESETWPKALLGMGVRMEDHLLSKALSSEIQALNELAKEVDADIGFIEKLNSDYHVLVARLQAMHAEFAHALTLTNIADSDMLEDLLRRCEELKLQWHAFNLQSTLVDSYVDCLEVLVNFQLVQAELGTSYTTKGDVRFERQNRKLDGRAQDMASTELDVSTSQYPTPPPGFSIKLNDKITSPWDMLRSLKEVMQIVMDNSLELTELKKGRQELKTFMQTHNEVLKKSLLTKYNLLIKRNEFDELQAQEEAKHQLSYEFQEIIYLFFEYIAQSQELRVVRYLQNMNEATWDDSVAKINEVEEKFKAMAKKLFELGWLATDLSADEGVDWKKFDPTKMWQTVYAKFVEKFSKSTDNTELDGLREELLARFNRLWLNSAGAQKELLGEIKRFRYLRTREGAAHTERWTQGIHKGVVDPIVDGVSGVLGAASNAVSGAVSYLGSFSPFGRATLPAAELTPQVSEDASLTPHVDEPSPVSSTKALSSDDDRISNSDEERGNSSNSDDEGEKISHPHIE